jgi:hypothetical protein
MQSLVVSRCLMAVIYYYVLQLRLDVTSQRQSHRLVNDWYQYRWMSGLLEE